MATIWYVIDHVGMGQLGGLFHTGEEADAYVKSKPAFGHFVGRYELAAVKVPVVEQASVPIRERSRVDADAELEQHASDPPLSTVTNVPPGRPVQVRQHSTQRGKDD